MLALSQHLGNTLRQLNPCGLANAYKYLGSKIVFEANLWALHGNSVVTNSKNALNMITSKLQKNKQSGLTDKFPEHNVEFCRNLLCTHFLLCKLSITAKILLICLLIASNTCFASPQSASSCASYLVAEASSGELLNSLDPDTARAPASMTKLMTAYVVLNKIKQGSIKLDDPVTITAEASKIGGSQVYLKQGEIFTIKELLNALLIQSANDSALALAQHISGSRESFVEEMNKTAADLGMTKAEFHSPHGLPPGKDQSEDRLSPQDFLTLARSLIVNHPDILEITQKYIEPFRNGTFEMRNHNGLLKTFAGTDGLKTGFYNQAGFCVTATAERQGVRLIAVLMGCPSSKIRNQQASELLSKGFEQFKTVPLLKAGDSITEIKITNGTKNLVPLISGNDVIVTTRISEEQKIERNIIPCELTAPVSKGRTCGKIDFLRNGQLLGSSPLIVAEDILKAGISRKLLGMIGW